MKQIIRSLGCCLAAMLILSACHHDDEPEPQTPPEKAVLMYMPWAGSKIYSYFLRNIADMRQTIIDTKGGGKSGVMVLIADTDRRAHLIHLKYQKNDCVNDTIATFTGLIGSSFYSVSGMTDLFNKAKASMPVSRYAIIMGCHGMGWLPIDALNDYAKPAFLPSSGGVWPLGNQEGTPVEGEILTRFFGDGSNADYNAEIATLAEAIKNVFGRVDFVLFDDCHMMNIEVAYDLRNVTDYLIGSTCEVMIEGMPYSKTGPYLLSGDYEQVVSVYNDWYKAYRNPYATIAVAKTSEIETLADVMRQINTAHEFVPDSIINVQKLDGFSPTVFYDMKSYVKRLCADDAVLFSQFEQQLLRAVPYAACTDSYYSARTKMAYPIREFSGITISDPSWSYATRTKETTAWWKATHEE